MEEPMHEFRKPVTVLMGLGFPSTIRNVERAHAVLQDWPHSQRGAQHTAALNACRAALLGQVDAETARSAFAEFARRAGILTEDARSMIASAAMKREGGQGAST
jgi:hypothetical protein